MAYIYIYIFFFLSHWILTFLAWVSPGAEPETKAGMQEVYLGSSPREQPWSTSARGQGGGTASSNMWTRRPPLWQLVRSPAGPSGNPGNCVSEHPPGCKGCPLPPCWPCSEEVPTKPPGSVAQAGVPVVTRSLPDVASWGCRASFLWKRGAQRTQYVPQTLWNRVCGL